jgi:ABC-type Fe2+-enterobactin transport system substrate-binding protein
MLLVALPAGLLARSPRRALTITLGVFGSLLIVQSIVVASSSTDPHPDRRR